MPTVRGVQVNLNTGQVSDRLGARSDIAAYAASCRVMANVHPVRQGGGDGREGLEYVATLKNKLVDQTGYTATAPNGGTAQNAKTASSELVTTTAMGTTDPYVVVKADLGSAMTIVAADAVDLYTDGSTSAQFKIQYSTDDITYSDFGESFTIEGGAANKRSRRRVGSQSARYWRLAKTGATDMGTDVTHLDLFRLWTEDTELSECRLIPFKVANDESYMLAATEYGIEIFSAGSSVAGAYIPMQSSELGVLKWLQSLDTLILFHEDHQPWRLFRQGDDDEWDFRAQDFDNIPQFTFSDTAGSGTDEVQSINFAGTWASTDTFSLILDGEETASAPYSSGGSGLATTIQTLLRNLGNTSASGITVSGTNPYTITFSGDDGAQDWPQIIAGTFTGDQLDVSTTTEGAAPAEDIMSASRGWPTCGTIYQGRLYLGGLKGQPDTLIFSKAGQFFDLNDRVVRADSGAVVAADTDARAEIFDLAAGDHLEVLTSIGPFFNETEPIEPATFALKRTGDKSRGFKQASRKVQIDGGLVYVSRTGNQLFDMVFEEVRQRYDVTDISVLTDVLSSPVDGDMWPATSNERTDYALFVNDDGSLGVLSTNRAQKITAFARDTTPGASGLFKAVGVDDLDPAYFAIQRTIDGTDVLYLEKFTASGYLDCAKHYTLGGATTVLTGLEHLEGATVQAYADGAWAGEYTVSSGQITLSESASSSAEVGLDYSPQIKTHVPRIQLPNGESHGELIKIPRVQVDVIGTASLTVGVAGNTPSAVAGFTSGAVSGPVRKNGLRGWSRENQVEIGRENPGPWKVRGIYFDAVV